jgi:U3 small nucleolar RNA-associated protein 15
MKEPSSLIVNAHDDYIKHINYHDINTLMTSSYDKTVKLWDIRAKAAKHSYTWMLNVSDPIEDFCQIDEYNYAVANGNFISLIDIRNSEEVVQTINAHQKTILNVRYDNAKGRLISAGSDSHLKFHDLDSQKVTYTMKLPSEILSFDISSDGQNYALGLLNGTLLVRSKKFTQDGDEELDMEPDQLMNNFLSRDQLVSTAKGYKYFYRGQYGKQADTDDIVSKPRKKVNLQKFEKFLKKFQYKNALNEALEKRSTDITVSLIEELIHRSSLEIAISNRSEDELILLLDFLIWKISDYRFSDLLVEVAKITIDMYSCVIGHSQKVLAKFRELYEKIEKEIGEQKQMLEVKSKLDTLRT